MRNVFKFEIVLVSMAVIAIAIAVGCATAPLKTDASTSGIRAAEEAGAEQVPSASLHLQLAKEELAVAQRMAANDEKEKAESMLSRAQADAELAVMLAREKTEKSDALIARDAVRQLRQDNK